MKSGVVIPMNPTPIEIQRAKSALDIARANTRMVEAKLNIALREEMRARNAYLDAREKFEK